MSSKLFLQLDNWLESITGKLFSAPDKLLLENKNTFYIVPDSFYPAQHTVKCTCSWLSTSINIVPWPQTSQFKATMKQNHRLLFLYIFSFGLEWSTPTLNSFTECFNKVKHQTPKLMLIILISTSVYQQDQYQQIQYKMHWKP